MCIYIGACSSLAATLHLWHLDDTNAPSVDAGVNPLPLQGLLNSATLKNSGFTNFGMSLNTDTGTNTHFGILLLQPALDNGPADNAPANIACYGANGAFSLEAVIKLDVWPTNAVGGSLDIITVEGDTTERIFNFRIEKSATPSLNFLGLPNSGVTGAATSFQAPLPLTGVHALATNVWFHVAVTYSGSPGTSNNLLLYWTRLDSSAATASLIGSNSLPANFGATLGDFAIGNEARASGGESEVFPGLIDEVRVSSVARA